eukprot:6199531-Pleurochrysis_carterae.AAC.2
MRAPEEARQSVTSPPALIETIWRELSSGVGQWRQTRSAWPELSSGANRRFRQARTGRFRQVRTGRFRQVRTGGFGDSSEQGPVARLRGSLLKR